MNSTLITTGTACSNKTKPQTKPKLKPEGSEGAKFAHNVEGDIKGKSSIKHKGKSSTLKSDTTELNNLRSDIASIKGMLQDLVPTVCVLKNADDQAQDCEELSSDEEVFQDPSVPVVSPLVLYVHESEEGDIEGDTTSDGKCVRFHCGFAHLSASYTFSGQTVMFNV